MARLSGKTGNVFVGVTTIHDCDTIWNELVDADVTESLETSDYKVGTGSAKFVCATGLANGDIIATDSISSTDLTACTAVLFWAKSTVNITTAGDLAILTSETSSCGGTPIVLNVPTLVANTWKFCKATGTFIAENATISVGAKLVANDPGAFTLYLDHIQGAKAIVGIKSWKLDRVVDVVDTTGFDSSGHRTYIPVLHGWSGSFEGYKDGAPITIGTVIGLELQESATATQQYRGTAIINGSHPSLSVDGLSVISYDFTGVGAIETATA
jgi:hypothetical protein